MNYLVFSIIFALGFSFGWFASRFWLFRDMREPVPPSDAYEVRLALTTPSGPVTRSLYSGDDLQRAKQAFYSATGPGSSLVELWTRGNHTASRRL